MPWSELQRSRPPWMTVRAPSPDRPLRGAPRDHARGRPAHGLRGGPLPEHRRVLGARHGDVPDPRRRLHARLPLLRRHVRAGPTPRPSRSSRCGSPGPSSAWACDHVVVTSVDRDDLPDRGAGPLRGDDPLDPPRQPRLRRRGARARLPRLPRGGASDRARGGARRLQPQHRDGRAPLPARAAEGRLPAGARPARHGQGRLGRLCIPAGPPLLTKSGLIVGMGETDEDVRRRDARPARLTASTSSRSGSTSSRPSATCRSIAG